MRSVLAGVELARQAASERMNQVPYGKKRDAKYSTQQIDVMTNAILKSPAHPRQQMKCLANMSKNDHHQASSPKDLQQGPHSLSSKEED